MLESSLYLQPDRKQFFRPELDVDAADRRAGADRNRDSLILGCHARIKRSWNRRLPTFHADVVVAGPQAGHFTFAPVIGERSRHGRLLQSGSAIGLVPFFKK